MPSIRSALSIAGVFAVLSSGCLGALAEEANFVAQVLSETTLSGQVIRMQNPDRFRDPNAPVPPDAPVAPIPDNFDLGLTPHVGISELALAGPANDDFAKATAVQPGLIAMPDGTGPSTLEAGEPVVFDLEYGWDRPRSGSAWFKWTVAESGSARISAETIRAHPPSLAYSSEPACSGESIFYPWGGISHFSWSATTDLNMREWDWNIPDGAHTFSAFRGDRLDNLTLIASGYGLEFDVIAGEVIWISLDSYEASSLEFMPRSFHLDLAPPPSNDSFASAISVEESSEGYFSGRFAGATREPGEPDLGPGFQGGSVWFKLKAATYGDFWLLENWNSATFAVFQGTSLTNLKLVKKTSTGNASFFGHAGSDYWIAVYRNQSNPYTFQLDFTGPRYRVYETTVDELMPQGLTPHFYGVRGETMLLYAKTETGWKCVETERISSQNVDLLTRPAAVEGKLRVITIESELPAPRVEFSRARGRNVATLVGIPGQTCAVSYSTDLIHWTAPQTCTLTEATASIQAPSPTDTSVFYRITQAFPVVTAPKKQITAAP